MRAKSGNLPESVRKLVHAGFMPRGFGSTNNNVLSGQYAFETVVLESSLHSA